MTRLYYWIHHTGRCDRGTGVQRVVTALAKALVAAGHELVPVRWCADREAAIRAERAWTDGLADLGGPALVVDEPGSAIHLAEADAGKLDGSWLLIPEVPHVSNSDGTVLPVAMDYARYHGLRTAMVFYDLIPLRIPGYEGMAAAHAEYARALAGAELVIPISRHSSGDLERWWIEQGYHSLRLPVLTPVLLPQEMPGVPRQTQPDGLPASPLRLLALGTVEPRKNQVALLRAFSALRRRRPDLDIRLDVVGGLHADVAATIRSLAAENPEIRLHDYAAEETKLALLNSCHATVFVSLEEGYGLPVAESLWHGKPCLCSNFGSMAEIAAGGGCLTVDTRNAEGIELALERLADDPDLRLRLASEACTRALSTWQDYAADVLSAMHATPALRSLTLIEGSHEPSAANEWIDLPQCHIRRLHWRSDQGALLPGTQREVEAHQPAAGQLADQWSILPATTLSGPVEATKLIANAHGMGLRVAVQASVQNTYAPADIDIFTASDIALFPTPESREDALAEALRNRPKTVNLSHRFRVAADSAAAAAVLSQGPRLTAAGPPNRPERVYYWVNLTVEQPFNTGIQRVARQLAAALQRAGVTVIPVKWNAATGRMVAVSLQEAEHLAKWGGPRAERIDAIPANLRGEWLIVPEITLPVVPPGSNAAQVGRQLGMRVAAIFYDMIPLKMPEIYPAEAIEQFHRFWTLFSEVDVALPISWSVAGDLCHYLRGAQLPIPRIVSCPLAGEFPGTPRRLQPRSGSFASRLELLSVGTWEPRKNYPRLLRAVRKARQLTGNPIDLIIVGRRAGFVDLNREIERIAGEMGYVTLLDHISDEELLSLYERCQASVFASWEEGFGLPVLESLWHGLPCLCHDGSALIELRPGGGTLHVNMLDETAIADGIARLASEDNLVNQLSAEAVARPIRSWDDYGADVLSALTELATPRGWPLPMIAKRRPLLSCAITTYNRAPWLRHSLSRLLEATRPWRDVVEVVVCDNASTDDTADVVAKFSGEPGFSARRNPSNVGMLGNLGATARACRGAFVWLLGDDDLIIDGAIENVLEGLAAYPDVEMAYMNYAYTSFDSPDELANADRVIRDAKPIAEGGRSRYVSAVREVAELNENLFTAIYACAFRRDHALRAYQQDVRGAPFSSLATCVPSSTYALTALHDRPAWWVGEPAVVVNMNVSWLRWALLWHLERMPDLYDLAERAGIDPAALDRYRLQHCKEAGQWARMVYFDAEDAIRENFSMGRLLERCKHLDEFRRVQLPVLRTVYEAAWRDGRVLADHLPPEALFARYGLG